MLKALGFDDSLIERIRYDLDFRSMGELPVMEIYNRICDWLRNQFPNEIRNCRAIAVRSSEDAALANNCSLQSPVS